MEWVYNANSDEPELFEAESTAPPQQPPPKHRIDLFSSRAAAEEPISDPSLEPEFYGDDDIIEERISPVDAFQIFAGRTFPIAKANDFSTSIYAEAHDSTVKPRKSTNTYVQLHPKESRSEKINRLKAEVDALQSEIEPQENEKDEAAFNQLSTLRDQLDVIENSIRIQTTTDSTPNPRVIDAHLPTKVDDEETSNQSKVTLQMVSPNLSAVSVLEQRLAAMEKYIGIPHLEMIPDIQPIAPMLEDIQDRLALISDDTLPEQLKRDAKDIARILQKELKQERGQDILNIAALMEEIDKWRDLVSTIPTLIERLRSLKGLQQEASRFAAALDTVGKQLDDVQNRNEVNTKLLNNVRQSMEVNLKSVNENLDILAQRINDTSKNSISG